MHHFLLGASATCCVLCSGWNIYGISSPYRLEISPINKTVRIMAKSTKHLREALQPILEKYSLDVTRVLLRRVRVVMEEVKGDM